MQTIHTNNDQKLFPVQTSSGLILLLGAPNDENGTLSTIASDRVECAFQLYSHNENMRILCTGGFGAHFNTTNRPHAWYTSRELIRKGVAEKDLLEFVPSANTVQDFRLSQPVIEKESPDLLFIVTSDFHLKRVRILYHLIINHPNVIFIPARSTLPEKELSACIAHEERAIRQLKDNNFILY